MTTITAASFVCPVCGVERDTHEGKPIDLMNHPIDDMVRRDHPDFPGSTLVCLACRSRYRTEYVRDVIAADRGELSVIERDVLESLAERDLLSRNINPEFDRKLTVGERVADRVSEFGGSWKFIGIFAAVLLGWISLNSAAIFAVHFDPFPYILLNLVLSCIAAIQAPVIMMSQNRQQSKDRLRAEHDYQVNLKAEIEVRQLHVKIDQLLTHQWRRLLEIQRVQMELVDDLMQQPRTPPARKDAEGEKPST